MSECKKCCHDIRTKDRKFDGINYIIKFIPDSCHSLLLQQVCDCIAWSNKPSAHGMLKNQLKPNLTITFDVSASHIHNVKRLLPWYFVSLYNSKQVTACLSQSDNLFMWLTTPLFLLTNKYWISICPSQEKLFFLHVREMVFLSLSISISFLDLVTLSYHNEYFCSM